MLKEILILRLFGLYDYKLEFNNNRITFITGPNGYGKTTILNIVDSLFRSDYEYLRNLQFVKIQITLESDGHTYLLTIDKVIIESSKDELHFELLDITAAESVKIIADFDYPKDSSDTLQLFFNTEKHYYIRDQRLTTCDNPNQQNLTNVVKENAKLFKDFLNKLNNTIIDYLQVGKLVFSNSISEEEYHNRKAKLLNNFATLINLNIMSVKLPDYNEQNAIFLRATLDAYDKAYQETADKIERITAFQKIIKEYNFANKEMQFSLEYGYRFVAKNETYSLLKLNELSSGEQHILIQVYELLFTAPTNALILVDEPEISAHLAWQAIYLRTMKQILRLTNAQCIVATHSPQVFDSNWTMAIDLYEQSNKKLL